MAETGAFSLKGCHVLYGGSFDPPHMGHQLAVLYLLSAYEADTVWLAPTWHHAFAKLQTAFEHRVAMCNLLIEPLVQGVGGAPRVRVTESEQDNPQGRTLDLLAALSARYNDKPWALAVGADILAETSKWHRWDEIASRYRVAVLGRQGYVGGGPAILPEISSSSVRATMAAGADVSGLLPASVIAYIRSHGLYRV